MGSLAFDGLHHRKRGRFCLAETVPIPQERSFHYAKVCLHSERLIIIMVEAQKSITVRRMLKLVVLVAALIFGVKAIILHPLFIRLDADIVHKYAWYTTLLYYLIDRGLLDLTVFGICYPATLYAIWRGGIRQARAVPIAFSLITVGKFALNYLVDMVNSSVGGALPDSGEILSGMPIVLANLSMELLLYALPVGMICLLKRRYDQQVSDVGIRAALTETPAPQDALPLTRLVSFKNPLQLTALFYSALVFLGQELGYHIYQINLFRLYGSTDGWAEMLVNLIADLFFSVGLYFTAVLLFTRFHEKEQARS